MAVATGTAILGGMAASAVGSALSSRSASKAAGNAANTQAAGQQRALDYQMEVEKLPLEYRDQAMQKLAGAYGMGEGATGMSGLAEDPYIKQETDRRMGLSEDAISRYANQSGMSRSGNVLDAYGENAPKVSNQVMQEYLGGLSGFAGTPMNTNAIANSMSAIGQTQGQGIMAQGQAKSGMYGNLVNTGMSGLGMYLKHGGI